jgi:NADH-quinone oxidoreductase subunit D
MIDDPKIAWPAKLSLGPDGMGNSLEHIQKIMGGLDGVADPPLQAGHRGLPGAAGQVYQAVESPRGELGVHIVSDGGTRPFRVHLREPSFINLQAVPR